MTGNKFLVYLLLLFFCAVPVFAQTEIFLDDMNGTNNAQLTARTPDTGTGYTESIDTTGNGTWEITASTRARHSEVSGTGSGAENAVTLLTFDPAPTSPDYNVGFGIVFWPTNGTDDPFGVVARYQDANNYYALVIYNDISGTSNVFITKRVGGTYTDIASDSFSLSSSVDYEFRVDGTSISFYGDTTEILSVTDSSITAAGEVGMFVGSMRGQASDDTRSAWHVEYVYVDEYEAEAPTPIIVASEGGDYTTIGAAYAAAYCGDVIQVREGTYTLSATLNINKTCSSGNEITIQNYPDESPEVTCTDPRTGFKRVEFNGQWNIWDGIEVYGCYDGLKVYQSNNTIKNSHIHHNFYQGILVIASSVELVNVTIDNNTIEYNGFTDDGITSECKDASWNPTPPHISQKHCHAVYFSDFGCSGMDGMTITNNILRNHAGRGIQWNGQGCSSKMVNSVVTGNTIENNSYGLALWYNVDDSIITENEFIMNSHPTSDDTSHGHFDIQSSLGNTIKNNTFFSNNSSLQTVQFRQTQSGNDIDENVWGYASTHWKWNDSWRTDFDTNFMSVTGFETNGCISHYTSFPCTP